ncbi:RidA family protein [Lysinibacillus capsici]|uniref:RidA family protein n=1 Tax=Lysinibacillus capsici TaxID=2115968 RepID=UPI0028BE5A31|nr:RidA family protein [Lysinibacillus capsici]WNN77525.1 RidA family protein [Lysinibacillus capsici]
MNIEAKIKQLGFDLTNYKRDGNKKFAAIITDIDTIYVSGHAAKYKNELLFPGIVGREVTVSQAKEAMVCALFNCLATVKDEIKSLDNIKSFLHIKCYVAIEDSLYNELPEISDYLTDKLYEIFEEKGTHTRTTVGVNVLPGNTSVEVEMILKISEEIE